MYERHVFVCTNKRDGRKACGEAGEILHGHLKVAARSIPDLKDKLRINKSGCLGLCQHGPAMVTYPETIWYANVTKEDVPEIVEKTIKKGEIVERLHYQGGPAE